MLAALALALSLSLPSAPSEARVVPGQLLVKLPADVKTDADAHEVLANVAARSGVDAVLHRRTILGWALVNVAAPDREQLEQLAATLRNDKDVAAVSLHKIAKLAALPNDPLMFELWAMDSMNAPAAWDVTQGTSSQRVGVVDSGTARAHFDLASRDVAGFDFISDPSIARDGDGRDDDYEDDAGADSGFHGTHVAGTILAAGNDGFGVAGVNWNAGLVTARALGEAGLVVDIAEGAAWLAGMPVEGVPPLAAADRVSVINMSLGSEDACSAFEEDVYGAIVDRGVTIVAAAGNEGLSEVGSPANCRGVIAVGAFGPSFERASYSNFSDRIDIVAPGGDFFSEDASSMILSADGEDPTGHSLKVGTSMATPHVAGVVSLMQAVNPRLSPAQINDIFFQSPFTCGGCDNESMLIADHAVGLAATESGDLADAPPVAPGSPNDTVGTDSGNNGDDNDNGDNGDNDNDNGDNGGDDDAPRACDEARGNWDCFSGDACVDGFCEAFGAGDATVGELCDDDDDCEGGLCEKGVCTSPCDFDCLGGYECDEDAIPGGLCEPERCSDDASVCDDDLVCAYGSDDVYVCATEYEDAAYGCAATPVESGVAGVALALVALVRRRRR